MGIRKGLERIFSPNDLSWLDGPLPGPGAAGTHPRERPEPGSRAEEVGAVLKASLGHSRPGTEPLAQLARGRPGWARCQLRNLCSPTVRADAPPGTADQPLRELGRGGPGAGPGLSEAIAPGRHRRARDPRGDPTPPGPRATWLRDDVTMGAVNGEASHGAQPMAARTREEAGPWGRRALRFDWQLRDPIIARHRRACDGISR